MATSNKLERCLGEILAALGGGERFAMVGGFAVSARTVPRFTADLDFAVAVATDAQAEALIYRLSNAGFIPETILERKEQNQIATARLRQSSRSPIVDLLFATCGIESEVVEDAEPLRVLGHTLSVARTGHLIAMKLVSRDDKRRPMDQQDLINLARVADAGEWRRAEMAVRLIEDRGFERKRDLLRALAELHEAARDL